MFATKATMVQSMEPHNGREMAEWPDLLQPIIGLHVVEITPHISLISTVVSSTGFTLGFCVPKIYRRRQASVRLLFPNRRLMPQKHANRR